MREEPRPRARCDRRAPRRRRACRTAARTDVPRKRRRFISERPGTVGLGCCRRSRRPLGPRPGRGRRRVRSAGRPRGRSRSRRRRAGARPSWESPRVSTAALRVGTQRSSPAAAMSIPLTPMSIVRSSEPSARSTFSRSVPRPVIQRLPWAHTIRSGASPPTSPSGLGLFVRELDPDQDAVAMVDHPGACRRRRPCRQGRRPRAPGRRRGSTAARRARRTRPGRLRPRPSRRRSRCCTRPSCRRDAPLDDSPASFRAGRACRRSRAPRSSESPEATAITDPPSGTDGGSSRGGCPRGRRATAPCTRPTRSGR